MDEVTLLWYLEDARGEIAWLRYEIDRLRLHIRLARELRNEGERKSFAYHPSPRRWESEEGERGNNREEDKDVKMGNT